MYVYLIAVAVSVGGLALLGVLASMIRIGILARQLPNLPLHARLNPVNILAMSDRWTPEIRTAHAFAVRCMLAFIASVILVFAIAFIRELR